MAVQTETQPALTRAAEAIWGRRLAMWNEDPQIAHEIAR